MKIAGILLSLLIIMGISGIGYSLAESAISIETSQSTYEYGDYLVMIINVSEITGEDASIFITDSTGTKNSLSFKLVTDCPVLVFDMINYN